MLQENLELLLSVQGKIQKNPIETADCQIKSQLLKMVVHLYYLLFQYMIKVHNIIRLRDHSWEI